MIWVSYFTSLQNDIRSLFKTLPGLISAWLRQHVALAAAVLERLALIGLLLLFFSWIGLLVFQNSAQSALFPDYSTTLANMHILLTTANFPDVMIPACELARSSDIRDLIQFVALQTQKRALPCSSS